MTNLFSLDKWMYREGVMRLQIPYPHTAGDRVLKKCQSVKARRSALHIGVYCFSGPLKTLFPENGLNPFPTLIPL